MRFAVERMYIFAMQCLNIFMQMWLIFMGQMRHIYNGMNVGAYAMIIIVICDKIVKSIFSLTDTITSQDNRRKYLYTLGMR